jgi:hypothetical protein
MAKRVRAVVGAGATGGLRADGTRRTTASRLTRSLTSVVRCFSPTARILLLRRRPSTSPSRRQFSPLFCPCPFIGRCRSGYARQRTQRRHRPTTCFCQRTTVVISNRSNSVNTTGLSHPCSPSPRPGIRENGGTSHTDYDWPRFAACSGKKGGEIQNHARPPSTPPSTAHCSLHHHAQIPAAGRALLRHPYLAATFGRRTIRYQLGRASHDGRPRGQGSNNF